MPSRTSQRTTHNTVSNSKTADDASVIGSVAYMQARGFRQMTAGEILHSWKGARGFWASRAAQAVKQMANENRLYIERRSDGKYTVRRGNAERASAVTDTQREAIERAKELNPGHRPDVERVRNTDKGSRDKWRKA